jgi:hypothetical protein
MATRCGDYVIRTAFDLCSGNGCSASAIAVKVRLRKYDKTPQMIFRCDQLSASGMMCFLKRLLLESQSAYGNGSTSSPRLNLKS